MPSFLADLRRAAYYFFAFVLPPTAVAIVASVSAVSRVMIHTEPPALTVAAQPPAKNDLPLVVFLTSNRGTQALELLTTYEVFGASQKFRLLAAAPVVRPSITTGRIFLIPDVKLEDVPEADVIVVPSLLDFDDARYGQWLRDRYPRAKLILFLGEGARIAARAGILDKRAATSHFLALPDLRKKHPNVQWVEPSNGRVVEAGKILTSAGLASSQEAALRALELLLGADAAHQVATEIEAPAPAPATGPGATSIRPRDWLLLAARAAFGWSRKTVGLLLYPGVGETGLGAALDSFPRTFSVEMFTLSEKSGPVSTRHGLRLLATESIEKPKSLPDLFIATSGGPGGYPRGSVSPLETPELRQWLVTQDTVGRSWIFDAPGVAPTRTLALLEEWEGTEMADWVARITAAPQKPVVVGAQEIPSLPITLLIKPIILGLGGLLLAWGVDLRRRRDDVERAASAVPKPTKS